MGGRAADPEPDAAAARVPSGADGGGVRGGSGETLQHRPVGLRCTLTPDPGDGGAVACTTDADCLGANGSALAKRCIAGTCGLDQCLIDADCRDGQACACSTEIRGPGASVNTCVETSCRVDADCGPMGLCSPATDGGCGGLIGFRCRKPADECRINADCTSGAMPRTDGGVFVTPRCDYSPEVDRWTCLPGIVCRR